VEVREILTGRRVALGLEVASKKRLLQEMAKLLCVGGDLNCDDVFKVLTERERLGSTGIGEGIALPHGRAEVEAPLAAAATLKNPLPYDAVDARPVVMAFALLIPRQAAESHLQILASLARMFSDAELRGRLMASPMADDFYAVLCGESCG